MRTLRDAVNHIIALPARVSDRQHWETAMACLLSAAEKGGPIMMARVTMMQALHAGKPETPPERRRKRGQEIHRQMSRGR